MRNQKIIFGTFMVALICTLSLSIFARVSGTKSTMDDPPAPCTTVVPYSHSQAYGTMNSSTCRFCVPTGEPSYTVTYGSITYTVTPRHFQDNTFPLTFCQYYQNGVCMALRKNPAFVDAMECPNLVTAGTGTN